MLLLAADLPAGKAPEMSVVRVRIHLGCVALMEKCVLLFLILERSSDGSCVQKIFLMLFWFGRVAFISE